MGGFSANAKAYMVRYMLGDERINIILEGKPIEIGQSGATKTLYASIRDAKHTGAAKPCLPRLELGTMSQRCYNPQWGSLRPDGIYKFELFQTPDFGFGGFSIFNADNAMAFWDEDFNWQNAVCILKIGEIDAAYTAFEDLWHFKAKANPRWAVFGSLVFETKLGKIDFQQPIQTTKITESKRLAPLLFGSAHHFKPELKTAASLTYAVDETNGTSSSFGRTIVYDGGNQVTSHATITHAAGTFVLDSSPVYGQTVAFSADSSGQRNKLWHAATDLLSKFSVTANFVDGATDFNVGGGIWVSTDHSFRVGKALSLVLGARGIWWLDADGSQVSIRRANPPEDQGSTAADFVDADVAQMSRTARLAPIAAHQYFIERYWDTPTTVIIEDPTIVQWIKAGGRIGLSTGAALADYPDALNVWSDEVLFGEVSDVAAPEVDLTALFDAPRGIYRIVLTPLQALEAWIGDYISVTTSKAPGFGSGKNLLVLGIELDFQNRSVVLEAFG